MFTGITLLIVFALILLGSMATKALGVSLLCVMMLLYLTSYHEYNNNRSTVRSDTNSHNTYKYTNTSKLSV